MPKSSIRLFPSAYTDEFARNGLPPFQEWPELLPDIIESYPQKLNAAQLLLDDAIEQGFGDRVAIVYPDNKGNFRKLTYRELQQLSDAFANLLTGELQIETGNRVLLRGFNGPMLAAAWLGVLKAGAVAVTTMPMLRARELNIVIEKAACQLALCDHRLDKELLNAVSGSAVCRKVWSWPSSQSEVDDFVFMHGQPFRAVNTSSDDVCLIAFTSGTTGVPKGCMHFHRDVMAMCDTFSRHVLRLQTGDICIGTPPLAFTFGLGGLLAFPLHARVSTVMLESATPEALLDAIKVTGATITFTAPTFYRQMAICIERDPERFSPSSLRCSVSAGEALPDTTRTVWRDATGVEMLDGIGATELIHIFVAAAGNDVRQGAIGKAVPGYEVAILDDDMRPLPSGETGRLAVKGPTGCRYLNDDRQKLYVREGWNLTGDACSMDADGYVYFKARTDDLIISSGYNIGAPEVESALLIHPAVAECAVVGIPDADRGQCVKAVVVVAPGHTPSDELKHDLQDHVKRVIAPYKYPRIVEFRDSLPRTETGKLQRFRLKEDS